MGKREEWRARAVHSGVGPDGQTYEWREATLADQAEGLRAIPRLLDKSEATSNGDGTITIELLDKVQDDEEYTNVMILRCTVSPRIVRDETDPDPDSVPLWMINGPTRRWLREQIEIASKLRGPEIEQARSFRGEPEELRNSGVDGGSAPHEAVGPVPG